MGARKHIKAEERKAALKTQYFAKLKADDIEYIDIDDVDDLEDAEEQKED